MSSRLCLSGIVCVWLPRQKSPALTLNTSTDIVAEHIVLRKQFGLMSRFRRHDRKKSVPSFLGIAAVIIKQGPSLSGEGVYMVDRNHIISVWILIQWLWGPGPGRQLGHIDGVPSPQDILGILLSYR